MFRNPFVPLAALGQILLEYWPISAVAVLTTLIALAVLVRRGSRITQIPKSAIFGLTLPLLASLILAMAVTDLDLEHDWVIAASWPVFLTLFVATEITHVVILVRAKGQRSLVTALLPVSFWAAVCVNGAGFMAVSALGRHWL